jgi:hypothetical protein
VRCYTYVNESREFVCSSSAHVFGDRLQELAKSLRPMHHVRFVPTHGHLAPSLASRHFFSTCALEFQICHLVLDPEEEKLPFPSRSVCLSIHHSSSDRRFPFHPSLILQPKSDSIPGTQRTIKLHKRLLAAVQGGGLPLGPSRCPRRIHRRSPSDGNKRGLCSCPK